MLFHFMGSFSPFTIHDPGPGMDFMPFENSLSPPAGKASLISLRNQISSTTYSSSTWVQGSVYPVVEL